MATNFIRAESPSKAEQKPVRHGTLAQPCAELSANQDLQSGIPIDLRKNQNYVNPSAGSQDANSAAPVDLAAIPTSNAAAQVRRNWADITEEVNPGAEEGFTLVQGRKRRRGSGNSPTTAAPSSNAGASRTIRRPQSSAGSVPRALEIRATRAHIADARARQASSSEEHCVYIEHSPELEPFHYLRALDRKLGGTAGVIQITKVNGHQLLGLTNRGLAERLISEGLEVEGTLLRAFPFRKRAERITVGNLPFFVADSAVITALSPYGRVTSIAPKQMKAGPYVYVDGRRDVFITLHEGITIERLPTRLDINIKGQAWPAYLSSGIRCSRCHGQGHRRAICPLLAGLANNTRMAPPTTPAGVPPPTTSAPPQRSAAQPPAPAPSNLAMEVCSAPPMAQAVLHPSAPRPSPPAAPALPMEETPSAPPPVTPAPSLQAPGVPVGPRPAKSQHPEPTPPARPDFVPQHRTWRCPSWRRPLRPPRHRQKNATRVDLDAFIEGLPSVAFAKTDALGLGREEVLDLLSSRTKAQRKGPLLSPPQCDALVGLIGQILDLKPGHTSNLYKVLGQVRAELTKTPAAAPTPPLPAPRPDGPIPPPPHGDTTTPDMATPPPPPSAQMEVDPIDKRCKELQLLTFELMKEFNPKPFPQFYSFELDLVEAVLYPEDREGFLGRFSPGDKKGRKRRRGSGNSPTTAAPSSNAGASRTIRRPQSSAGSVPRAQEIRATRAHIADARARQASSSEEQCVYIEHSPELEPFHYLRALDRKLGGTAGVIQITKVNGHQLLGLTNRGLAERLISEGLERILLSLLPSPIGRVTSIAPKQMKAGPYVYVDGRRDVFITLHEGITIERLPTRLDINIKGQAWPAYLSSGIRCSRCHGQGHRRAICPLLAGLANNTRMAPPTTPAAVPPPTTSAPPQRSAAQPPAPAPSNLAMEVCSAPPMARAVLHPSAPRPSPPAAPALPMEETPSAPPPVIPAPSLQAPEGSVGPRSANSQHPEPPPARPDFVAPRDPLPAQKTLGPAAPTPDVEMSIVEETSASSTSLAKNATRVDLDAFIERHPSLSFAGTDALGLGREEVLDLLSSRTKAQRKGPLLSPPQCDALAGLIGQILDLRPGAASNLYKVLGQVKAELRTTPAAVPTPPPPAPRPAETTSPALHGERTSPDIATPPPPLSTQFIDACYDQANDIIYALSRERFSEPLSNIGVTEGDIVEAIIFPEDREPLFRHLSTQKRTTLAEIISAASECARNSDPFVRGEMLLGMPSSASPGSSGSAGKEPGRPSIPSPTGGKISSENGNEKIISKENSENRVHANPPTGVRNANLAAARGDVTTGSAAATSSNGAARVLGSWADSIEDQGPGEDDDFTVFKSKKRRRDSPGSPAAAAPSSGTRGAGATRRPRSSTGWAPRAEEVRTTRAHIAEARARQASSTEDHCVYIERSLELEPYNYMRALDRMLGGTREVFQMTKMNGHFLVGLANRGLGERLINEGLEVEGTLHRAFPFRKRTEIYGGQPPHLRGDAAVTSALSPFGRVTSIAPKLMKASPYIYNDGRREAFIILREGMTIEMLPTPPRHFDQGRGLACVPVLWDQVLQVASAAICPASTSGVPQSNHGGLRRASREPSCAPSTFCTPAITTSAFGLTRGGRASCPSTCDTCSILDIEMTAIEETSASSTSSSRTTRNATRIDLDAFIETHPSVSFAWTDALGLGREEVLDLLSSRTKAQRNGPLLSPPQGDALAGIIKKILDLRPGAGSNLYKVLGQVKVELRTTPAAVPTPPLPAPRPSEPAPLTYHGKQLSPASRTPPLPASTEMEECVPITEEERCAPPPPAPWLAGPIPPVPNGDTTTPAMMTPPPPLSMDRRWKMAGDLIHELSREIDLEHTFQSQVDMDDIVRAVLYPGDREPFIKRRPTRDRYIRGGFISTAIWRARDSDPSMLESMSELRKLLPD
ncbi:hypothetical protein LAZ67_7002560 [Cordylochernes scorpioides]|uniref:CCHC-type domain-containing protein n=1 Tax=Cordylochernes scorpioides TaxID=51811 RepID=A0ABY6KTC4_9ARAC|nr:hypothetical protein LAZ67_7002560 [Cordylochernes scorpioides]